MTRMSYWKKSQVSGGQIVKQAGGQGGLRGHEPSFDKILPSAMKKLVEDGLFEAHQGSYRITAKGQAYLNNVSEKKDD